MRRKVVLVLAAVCALLVLSPILGVAQDKSPRNEVSLNVGDTIVWLFQGAVPVEIGYERVLSDHFTLAIFPVVYLYARSVQFEPWLEVDWHPFDMGLKGLFVGLAAVGSIENGLPQGGEGMTYFVGLAPALGYQFLLPWNLDLDFAFSLSLGEELQVPTSGASSSSFMPFDQFYKRIAISVGYRF